MINGDNCWVTEALFQAHKQFEPSESTALPSSPVFSLSGRG